MSTVPAPIRPQNGPPMPKLFPDILSEQDLRDIGEYLFSNLQEK